MGILSGQEEALGQLDSHVNELKQKENELNQELQVKKVELERAEKRLESLQHASPSRQNELMQYENDLSIIYKMYVEKIRNQAYLENRLQNFQKYETAGHVINVKRDGEIYGDVGIEVQPGEDQDQQEDEGAQNMQGFGGEEEEEDRF